MVSFGAAVRDAAWRVNGRNDLARMNRVVEDRRTHEDWGHAVCVYAGGWTNLLGGRKLGV